MHITINIKKSLYLSLVRSQLTYCSQLWFPNKIQDIILLERVQRRATKYILNNYNISYKLRLLNILQLLDLLFFVKCFKNPSDSFNVFNHVTFHSESTRSSFNRKFEIKFQHTSTTRHQYFNRISLLWNTFSPIDLSLSFTSIKRSLKQKIWIYLLHTLIQTIPAHL